MADDVGDVPSSVPVSRDATGERQLVEGLVTGSHQAIVEFLERTHHPVYCMAARFSADRDQRRDWTHSVLLGVLEDLRRGRFLYTRPGCFWAWFRKRAYYRLLDECRRHRKAAERTAPLPTHAGEPVAWDLPGTDDPEREMERVELLEALESCLERISSLEHRRALCLLLLEDRSYAEIASAMGAPLNTVRAWIRRGRIALRRCLAERLDLGPAGGRR